MSPERIQEMSVFVIRMRASGVNNDAGGGSSAVEVTKEACVSSTKYSVWVESLVRSAA